MNRGIDPTQDAAGILGDECFLCGKPRCNTSFGPKGELSPQLAAHADCFHGRDVGDVIDEYTRRLHDLVGARRPH